MCKYLHQSSKNYHDTKSEKQHKRDKQEVFIETPDDDNVLSLNEDIFAKEEVIKRSEEINSKLISENEGLVEENNIFQRILKNMNQEIKLLKSQTQ